MSFVDAGRAFTLIPVQAMGLAWLARRRLHPPLYASIARNVQLPGVGLTNIGRVAIESVYGPLRIERLGFAASPGVLADFAVTAATLDDTLWMNFMAMEPCITRAHAERLAARTAALLREHGVGVRSAA